ncbi:MAG: tetratricopeptide repeat protein, partial [Candidatus Hydrogenedentota bacterium]
FPQVEEIKGWDPERIYETAMDMSRRAAEVKPDDYTFLQDYAQGYFSAENFGVEPDWSEAAQAWEQAREHAPREDVVFHTWLNEARAWERDGSPEEALRCVEEALELQPDSHAAQNLKDQVRQEAEGAGG